MLVLETSSKFIIFLWTCLHHRKLTKHQMEHLGSWYCQFLCPLHLHYTYLSDGTTLLVLQVSMPTPESANAAAYGSSGGYPANPGGPGQIGFGVIFFVTLLTIYNMPQYTCVLVAVETIQEVRTELQNSVLVHVYEVLSDHIYWYMYNLDI